MCERLLLQSTVHSKLEMRLSSNTQRVRTFGCSISTVRCSRGAEDGGGWEAETSLCACGVVCQSRWLTWYWSKVSY